MPIVKNGQGQVVESTPGDLAQFNRTGVMRHDDISICDDLDRLKQIQFNASKLGTNSQIILKAPVTTPGTTTTITFPATTGTLLTDASLVCFSIFQPDAGTSPVADSDNDTLTLTSSDSTITITGNATTDTINYQARVASASVSGILSTGSQTIAGDKTLSGSLLSTYSGSHTLNLSGSSAKSIWFGPTAHDANGLSIAYDHAANGLTIGSSDGSTAFDIAGFSNIFTHNTSLLVGDGDVRAAAFITSGGLVSVGSSEGSNSRLLNDGSAAFAGGLFTIQAGNATTYIDGSLAVAANQFVVDSGGGNITTMGTLSAVGNAINWDGSGNLNVGGQLIVENNAGSNLIFGVDESNFYNSVHILDRFGTASFSNGASAFHGDGSATFSGGTSGIDSSGNLTALSVAVTGGSGNGSISMGGYSQYYVAINSPLGNGMLVDGGHGDVTAGRVHGDNGIGTANFNAGYADGFLLGDGIGEITQLLPDGSLGFFRTTPAAQQTGDIGAALAAYGLVTSPKTNASVTTTNNNTSTATFNTSKNDETIYDTSSTLAASLTIALPATTRAGQTLRYVSNRVVTTVTVTGTVSVGAAVTSFAANASVAWQAVDGSGTFIRIQ